MQSKDKIRKPYKKPQVCQVELNIEEAVLQACKSAPFDPAGKGKKYCGHNGCKRTYGS